jgi:hypothetical protein
LGGKFGFVAMLLLVAYVVSTRHPRQEMDVAVFMATTCPIAAAVLPLAIANGDVRDERYRVDVHADPHGCLRGRGQRAVGVRAEDDRDRHHRDRPR